MIEDENMALSQDSIELEYKLLNFLPRVQTRASYDHFKSTMARQLPSYERKLIESALSGFSGFQDIFKAKIIALAIALGGRSLELF
jgi:Trp operon repressor